jgi:hypothetical protein
MADTEVSAETELSDKGGKGELKQAAEFVEVFDDEVGIEMVRLSVEFLIRDELLRPDGLHAAAFSALDVAEPVVANEQRPLRVELHGHYGLLKDDRVRFDPADVTGNDDDLKPLVEAMLGETVVDRAGAGVIGDQAQPKPTMQLLQ